MMKKALFRKGSTLAIIILLTIIGILPSSISKISAIGANNSGDKLLGETECKDNNAIFNDNFDDGEISDWTVTTSGNGIFEASTAKYVSVPYSAHMKSLNKYDQAMGVSPSYSLNLSEEYNVTFNFLVPSTNNHWFEVFNNHQTYLLIDSGIQLKWYDASSSHLIMNLNTDQWYFIEITVQPSINTYDVYVDDEFKQTCDMWVHTGFENTFRIGDRNNDQGSYIDYGEAFWDDFVVSQTINEPPNIPNTPSGPSSLEKDESGSYSTSATDNDGDQVQYRFDWNADGSHDYSTWTGLGKSGHTGSLYHSWSSPGAYYVKAQAKDEHGLMSGWSGGLRVTVTSSPNDPPYTPSNPKPTDGATDVDVNTNLSWTGGDPNPGDTITYDVYFGSMPPIQKVASNISISHYNPDTLANSLTYHWNVVAWDNRGASTHGPSWHFTTCSGNNPPGTPSIDGPTSGKDREEYSYDIKSTDPDDHMIKYIVDWGDDNTDTTAFYDSGVTVTVLHIWSEQGTYEIRVKAVDEHDAESNWATLSVSIPKTKPINPLFLRILEWLTERFPLLARLLQLPVFEKLMSLM